LDVGYFVQKWKTRFRGRQHRPETLSIGADKRGAFKPRDEPRWTGSDGTLVSAQLVLFIRLPTDLGEEALKEHDVGIEISQRSIHLFTIRRPGDAPDDHGGALIEVGDLTHWTTAGREQP